LEGASVTEKGYSIGVSTDSKGRFSINLAEDEGVLVISHVGYQVQEIAVGTRNSLDIRLVSLNAQMDAVVIVGYGTQKKSDITGSVTSIPRTGFRRSRSRMYCRHWKVRWRAIRLRRPLPLRAVQPPSRSGGSIHYREHYPAHHTGRRTFPGTTNDISPATIESIEVLKDASATAIYGTRGSSGVILITTKRGATGRPAISYSGFAGPEAMAHKMKPMDGATFKIKNVNWNQQTGGYPRQPISEASHEVGPQVTRVYWYPFSRPLSSHTRRLQIPDVLVRRRNSVMRLDVPGREIRSSNR